MDLIEFSNLMNKYGKEIEIKFTEEQLNKFYKYMNMLIEWNEKINLTAIIEPKEIILKHFIDSLAILKYTENSKKFLDIGTGAGFPGIPIKIMRKYLEEYTKEIDDKIKIKNIKESDIKDHLIKIKFFQHERLIHLLVTLSYGLFLFLSVMIFTKVLLFIIITYIVLIVLLFYVRHYFFLENHVQYLYKQYDSMKKLIENDK